MRDGQKTGQANLSPNVQAASHGGVLAITQADLDNAASTAAETAAAAAIKRCEKIITSAPAESRPQFAMHLALHTCLPADDAIAALRISAVEVEAHISYLDGRVPSPNVGFDWPAQPAKGEAHSWDQVTAFVNAETKRNSGSNS